MNRQMKKASKYAMMTKMVTSFAIVCSMSRIDRAKLRRSFKAAAAALAKSSSPARPVSWGSSMLQASARSDLDLMTAAMSSSRATDHGRRGGGTTLAKMARPYARASSSVCNSTRTIRRLPRSDVAASEGAALSDGSSSAGAATYATSGVRFTKEERCATSWWVKPALAAMSPNSERDVRKLLNPGMLYLLSLCRLSEAVASASLTEAVVESSSVVVGAGGSMSMAKPFEEAGSLVLTVSANARRGAFLAAAPAAACCQRCRRCCALLGAASFAKMACFATAWCSLTKFCERLKVVPTLSARAIATSRQASTATTQPQILFSVAYAPLFMWPLLQTTSQITYHSRKARKKAVVERSFSSRYSSRVSLLLDTSSLNRS
mmetsp:Transcript_2139/g.6278  ORF Transcript_2139/g.6278 Transcript_2139/m.6278 type:complete len:377 (-) Transcript_2139:765-1895(-)